MHASPSRQADQWSLQTGFVLSSGILSQRGISHADKIIPGSYHDDEESTVNQGSSSNNGTPQSAIDGKGLTYPCIPVVDTALSLRTNRHTGTKGFLSKMSPTDRTTLFMEPQIASRLLGDVLTAYYDNHWEALLGDLQLAYVLFLYLQCLASLEHWYVFILKSFPLYHPQTDPFADSHCSFLSNPTVYFPIGRIWWPCCL